MRWTGMSEPGTGSVRTTWSGSTAARAPMALLPVLLHRPSGGGCQSPEPRAPPVLCMIMSVWLLLLVLLALVEVGCVTAPASPPAISTPRIAPPPAPGRVEPPPPVRPAEQVREVTPEARAQGYVELGQALIARGEMAAAATALREALRREPDLIQAPASLGLALYGMGDLDAAGDELRAAPPPPPHALTARLTPAAARVGEQGWGGARGGLPRTPK